MHPFATRPPRASGSSHSAGRLMSVATSIQSTTDDGPARVLGERVLRAAAALGRRQPSALGGDRAALHAVRRGDVDGDRSVAAFAADLVDLRRTEGNPHFGDVLRDLALELDVVRLVVA